MFEESVGLVDAMASVASVDIALLDADGLLEHLAKIQQLESGLAARKAATMVAFHHVLSGTCADLGHESPRPGDRSAGPAERRWSGEVLRSVSDEIGLALGAHRRTAALWLNRAAVLVDRFPATLRLLGAGGISVAAAQHVARELALIVDDELRGAVEQIVLAWGRRYGWQRIKKIAKRETQKVLAEYESLLHAQRQDERTTYTVDHDGGMADLVVSTSAIDITAIMAALTLRARELQREGDPRDLNQLRTDLAVNRLLGNDQSTTGDPHSNAGQIEPTDDVMSSAVQTAPDGRGSSVDAADSLTTVDPGFGLRAGAIAGVDAGAAVGVGRVSGVPESGLNPAVAVQVVIHCTYAEAEALATGVTCTGGELEGYGHLPQDALAMAFTRARFRYRLTDRTPRSDPARYTPSPGLDQHVRDRDQTCRFPGCTARVQSCDLDHRVPFPEGPTDDENLEPFCRHHHRLKHHGDWQVFTTGTGTLVFISPTGRAYLEPPTMPNTHPGTPSPDSRPNTNAA